MDIDKNLIGEYLLVKRLVTDVYPSGIVSVVSDTYDFFRVLSVIVPKLKTEILARQPDALGFAKVVFRPDSGNPVDIICGAPYQTFSNLEEAEDYLADDIHDKASNECEGSYNHGKRQYTELVCVDGKFYKMTFEVEYGRWDKTYYFVDSVKRVRTTAEITLTPEEKGAVQCLWDVFGGTITETGHKVLDSHVGLIYGDSITLDIAKAILEGLEAKGFASCNIVLGIGSHTYQYVTRDTYGSAIKATFGTVDGEDRVLFKQPKTDSGLKNSARGLLRVEFDPETNKYILHELQTREQENDGLLETVFENGEMRRIETLEQIRNRLNN